MVAGQVQHDRPQVGDRPIRVLDPVERTPEPEKRFLHKVLGRIAVVREQTRHPYQRTRVLAKQLLNQGVILNRVWRSDRN